MDAWIEVPNNPAATAATVPRHSAERLLPRVFCLLGASACTGSLGTVVGVQQHLADADCFWGNLNALVFASEFERFFQSQGAWWGQVLEAIRGSCTHVGELLFLGDVHVHVIGAGVLANDHAL